MTVYQCPRCGKGLVTEDPEPPGIIHKCDDCVERMIPADDDGNGRYVDTGTDREEGSQ